MSDILNLGAGMSPIENAINLDVVDLPGIQMVWDLNRLPWPFIPNEFDIIVARAVLEHLDLSLLRSFDECWRILRPGGILEVKLPYWEHEHTWDDPTHKRGYTLTTFDFFDDSTWNGKTYGYYTPRRWKILWKGFTNNGHSSIGAKMEALKP